MGKMFKKVQLFDFKQKMEGRRDALRTVYLDIHQEEELRVRRRKSLGPPDLTLQAWCAACRSVGWGPDECPTAPRNF